MTFYHGKGRYALPAAMTEAQIADAINGFAESAGRAIEVAGFDAIEIHGANGYLLDQFLTDYANNRADRWGGATENRVRLILETFKAVRAKVGAKVPVGVRISQGKVNDYHHKWADAERDAEIVFGSLAEAGADFIHVTEFEAWKPAFTPGGPSLMHLAKRYAPKAAIFANGSLHNIEQAVAALDDGADIITIARGALANPDLPRRLSDRGILNDFDPDDPWTHRQHQGNRAGDVKAPRLPRLVGVCLELHFPPFESRSFSTIGKFEQCTSKTPQT